MRKIMSANEAASRSEEVKAQYCDINAYNDFMEMLADEIKIAVNNGWTSTMPLRWGYLPDGYANKVITELSELGYKVNTVEDKMTVSWYDCKQHKYESEHSMQTNRLFEKGEKKMARYIDKDKLVNKLKENCETLVKERWFDDYVQGYSSAIDDVVAEPTADVQEVKHGKWITVGEGITERTVCSNCKSQKGGFMKPPFCNQCGAKMDGKE